MSTPWEDTIVMALRDSQWLENDAGSKPPRMPDLFIKMDGDTEKALGDVIYQNGERLYLFEAKSSRSLISTEWTKKDKEGKPKYKASFLSLSHLTNMLASDWTKYQSAFQVSLACHHFVYWSDEVFDYDDSMGNILAEPYLLACAATRGCPISAWTTEEKYEVAQSTDKTVYEFSERVPFSAIRSQTAYLTTRNPVDEDDQGEVLSLMGAEPKLFFDYLKFLLEHGGGGAGALNAVICSDRGTFYKNVKSVAELRQQLDSTGKYGTGAHLEKKLKAKLPRLSLRPMFRNFAPISVTYPAPKVDSKIAPKIALKSSKRSITRR